MGQAIYWTKIVSAFTYYIFVICHLYGWLGLLTKKTKKITKYGENDKYLELRSHAVSTERTILSPFTKDNI